MTVFLNFVIGATTKTTTTRNNKTTSTKANTTKTTTNKMSMTKMFSMTNWIYLGVHEDEDNGMENDGTLSKHVRQDCGGQRKTLK